MGYRWAGATKIIGVDIEHQPDYPFEFVQGDAFDWNFVSDVVDIFGPFDLVHSSPPCQKYSIVTRNVGKADEYPETIEPAREVLAKIGLPYVIENVPGAPIRRDFMLCGEAFGLEVIRHRYFEVEGFLCPGVQHRKHRGRVQAVRHGIKYTGPYVAAYGNGSDRGDVDDWRRALQVDWTRKRKSLANAVPPAYTEWIGWWFTQPARRDARTGP